MTSLTGLQQGQYSVTDRFSSKLMQSMTLTLNVFKKCCRVFGFCKFILFNMLPDHSVSLKKVLSFTYNASTTELNV